MRNPIVAAVMLGTLLAANLMSAALGAEDQAVTVTPAPLAKELVGTWVLLGQPGKIAEPPATGARFKICTENRWTNAQADAQGGKTVHKGGTYTLAGDIYEETVEFDNGEKGTFVKQSFKFTATIQGDTLTLIGIGNPWREVLRRVREDSAPKVEKP